MKQSTKRVVGWGAGMGIGAALLVLIAVLVMILTAEPAAQGTTTTLGSVQTEAGEETAAAAQEPPACNYPEEWVGKEVDEAAVKKFSKAYRILGKDSMMTMDYSADRINVETDDKGIVVRVFCG